MGVTRLTLPSGIRKTYLIAAEEYKCLVWNTQSKQSLTEFPNSEESDHPSMATVIQTSVGYKIFECS